jgi:hypothetical protein
MCLNFAKFRKTKKMFLKSYIHFCYCLSTQNYL